MKGNKVLTHVTMWLNLENIMLSESGQEFIKEGCFRPVKMLSWSASIHWTMNSRNPHWLFRK